METQKAIEIYTESTPNPETLKFVSNSMLLPNKYVDFPTLDSAAHSPFAQALYGLSFVKGVFISNNFVTITKTADQDWFEISPEIREFIKEYLLSGKELLSAEFFAQNKKEEEEKQATADDPETQIRMMLDKYVRPAVEMDGGHIEFKSFKNGIVTVQMQGACSGCPSSSVTLKSGIEGLLKRMVPGVEEVVAEQG